MKPSSSKFVFNLFTLSALLVMLLGGLPASPVQAKALASPLLAGGDFVWDKYMGGTGDDAGHNLILDSSGNVYTMGSFQGIADFDPGAATFNLTSAGDHDIFISKLDSSGNFVWARRLGGTGYDVSYGIALDSGGNVYTTGSFAGTVDFDPGTGSFNLTSTGDHDIFISKLDSDGNFVWARDQGGMSYAGGGGIAIDSSGNVYTTGNFYGTVDFDPGAGTFNLTSVGYGDGFISKLDSSGNFAWAESLGGPNFDSSLDISLDSSGNVYTTGILGNSPESGDIFVSKWDSSGNSIWVRHMGGTGNDLGNSLALDSSGNIYTTGWFQGTADLDPGAGTFNLVSAGGSDGFISKLDSNGNFIWARRLGGTSEDRAFRVALDSNGNVYTTGNFADTVDFDPGADTFNLTSVGGSDGFVSKLDNNGDFVWTKSLGGTGNDGGYGIALDSSGNVYTTGTFGGDIFVLKLENDGVIRYATSGGTGDCSDWANACTLQTALTDALNGDEIWVASGTHKPTIGTDRFATFQLKEGVAVYGGFAGTETARGQRNPAINLTILSGDLNGNDNSNVNYDEPSRADNSYHVVIGATGATLDGFTITAGNANGTYPHESGAGIFNWNGSSPTLTNLIISNNSANYGGGMLNWNSSNPTLTNVTFSGNAVIGAGGGISNEIGSSPTLINVTFSDNSAAWGGGMSNLQCGSGTMLTNVTFSGNSAVNEGGGMYNYRNSSPTLTNVTFSGNSAGSYGGGMYNWDDSSPTVRNTLFWGNLAPSGGTQIYNNDAGSTPIVNDSVVQGSYAGGTNIITTDPLLGTLGNYGGYTQTIPLLAGSSAIDTGNDSVCPAADQRGVTRPQGEHCDIGAFEATLYIISGNAGVAGATLTYTGGSTTADGAGGYTFSVSHSWTGTVTPSKAGYTFTPTSITISTPVTTNLTGQNFTASLNTYTISGNAGVAGTTLAYTGGSTIANGSGLYSFTVSHGWTSTVTPSKTGYTFSPVNRDYTDVTSDQTDEDYSATLNTYTISGNAGVAGATLTYTGGSTTANGSGAYAFTVSHGWSGTVTSSKTGYTFTPSSLTISTSVTANLPGQNFTAAITLDNVATYRRATGGAYWLNYNFVTASFTDYLSFGDGGTTETCYPVAMDFDGDGLDEPTHLCGGGWHFFETNGAFVKSIFAYMQSGDIPVPGDYNGDGKDEVAVYRRTTGGAYWLFYDFATASFTNYVSLGDGGSSATCYPAAMDFDGDGSDELTHLCGGGWHFFETNGTFVKSIFAYMQVGDVPAPGDYNGDGTDEVAVYRRGTGGAYWLNYDFSSASFVDYLSLGNGGATAACYPATMDFDGDGVDELTHLCGGGWHFFETNGSFVKSIFAYMQVGDKPVPGKYGN